MSTFKDNRTGLEKLPQYLSTIDGSKGAADPVLMSQVIRASWVSEDPEVGTSKYPLY